MKTQQFVLVIGVVLLVAAPPRAAGSNVPWHGDLLYPGGGFWRTRIPIRVENASDEPLSGRLVELRVGSAAGELPAVGLPVKSLRICNERGAEYLYQLAGTAGSHPVLAHGDVVRFAVDVGARSVATYYLYGNNPDSRAVPEFLAAELVNGNFETGSGATPSGWMGGSAGDNWAAQYLVSGGRDDSRCVYVRGSKGTAPPRMLYWRQQGIIVNEGSHYVLRGWVKASNVTGTAGWMIQINSATPQFRLVANRTEGAGAGTYDWREVKLSFVVPKGGHTLDITAVLNGAGEAWYDDVTLAEESSSPSPLRLMIDAPERMELASSRGSDAWDPLGPGDWRVRAELRIIRLESEPAKQILVTAEIRRAASMLFYVMNARRGPYAVRVVDPARRRVLPSAAIGERVALLADLPSRSDQRFFVYLGPATQDASVQAYGALVHSRANLVRAADFEDPGQVEKYWLPCIEDGKPVPINAELSGEGIVGVRTLRIDVPRNAPLQMAGTRQTGVRVRPDTTYLYAGYVKTEDVREGRVDLSGTFLSSAGAPLGGAQRFRTGEQLLGTEPWLLRSGIIVTPAECVAVDLEVGARAFGKAWFDGILFAEAAQAAVGTVQPSPDSVPAPDFAVWSVNPMVKLFPDDPPRAREAVALFAARNEWEPLQVGIWSRKDLRNVRAQISGLRSPSGRTLPAAKSFRIATVDVDKPSAYYCTLVPEWMRRVARFENGSEGCQGAGRARDITPNFRDLLPPRRTDGWPGEWPDPLPPLGPFDLAAGRTQGIWFDIFVPEDATSGDYEGTVTVEADGQPAVRLPLRLTVWDFALPVERHLRVVYDLGLRGEEGDDPKVLRQWLHFLAEHRISADSVCPLPVFSLDEQGQVRMDARRFDEMAPYYFDELHMNWSYMPTTFYGVQWAQPLRPFMGLQPHTPEYEKAFKSAFKLFVDHVTERGWRDKFIYYLSDEPFFQPQVVKDLRYMIGLARGVAPDVLIFASTWDHCSDLDGYLSLWGIGQYGGFPVEIMQERLKAGDKLVFTTDGQQALDTPYLATERLLPAYCFKYGVMGYEFWGVSRWAMDVWERSWENFHRQTDDEKVHYWFRYPNGDGYLAYPGEKVGVDGPVPSLRLKGVREGSEDYEYYIILQNAIGDARKRGADVSGAERALDAVRGLVAIPNHGGLHSAELLPEPDAIYRVRKQVAEEILRLRK